MTSFTTQQFWKLYHALSKEIQGRADRAYRLWRINPHAHGLFFKRVGKKQPVYSVRIGQDYRALSLHDGDTFIWFWIGAHDEYERLLKGL
jgi:hypothetical protein